MTQEQAARMQEIKALLEQAIWATSKNSFDFHVGLPARGQESKRGDVAGLKLLKCFVTRTL